MRGYTTRDVAELLGVSPERVRAFARAGFIAAERGPRREYRFSFQDVVLLRTAKELTDTHIHSRRLWRALRSLKAQLPNGQPLTSMRIVAQGEDVLARKQDVVWSPESGQVHFDFSVCELANQVAPLVEEAAEAASNAANTSAEDWYEIGLDFEVVAATKQAEDAYRHALELNPDYAEASINLGFLLQSEGKLGDAVRHYRRALEALPDNVIALFNLGTALEDLGRRDEAADAYAKAVALDAEFADAHYNLARLHEQRGDKRGALRHLARYKSLTR